MSGAIDRLLAPWEHRAALELVARVRREVPAELWRAFLFGSKARGQGRPDSDLDILLVFRVLPPDREPQAGMAEAIADEVAAHTGVPVQTWTVSLPDLDEGCRTPMLVDALDDGIPLWPAGAPPVRVRFTPADARWCTGNLLARVAEGGREVADCAESGDFPSALRRARDDLVRMCTAALLLDGITRPRRGEAVSAFAAAYGAPPDVAPLLAWAAASYGPRGNDDESPVPPPPGGLRAATHAVERLRTLVMHRRDRLDRMMAA